MKRLYLLSLYIILTCTYICAQESVKSPDLQTADYGFFDPTRKTEKEHEVYHFSTEYRLEVGYNQSNQRTRNLSYPDMYLHGLRIGGTVTFVLPLHFSLQTGLLYTLSYGTNQQHWRSITQQTTMVEYITHRVLQHELTLPLRANYTIPVWKKLNIVLYTGPQLHFGMAENDYLDTHLSAACQAWLEEQGVPTSPYERLSAGELLRTNIQWGLGGAIEWDRYRLQAGYDFGLNNRIKKQMINDQHMWEWSWYVSFNYKF